MDWTKGPVIGRGSSATVSFATTATGDLFAVKSAELSTSHFLQKEQRFLSQLKSPYIIECVGFDVDYDNNIPMYNLFMEYAPGGSISDVIKKHGGCLDECLIRSYTRQILLGLNYLHSNNLVHCDIKCQNVLVTKNGIKIGDLGCAKLADDEESSVFSGTPVFMAPEVARGEDQGFAADVWAIGCVVVEMATGCNPWPDLNDPVSALYRIGYSGEVPLFPMWLSVEAKDFLEKCLRTNVKERWTATELLQHPFVNSNSCFEKTETFPKDSPSSILDQGFWDSLEVREHSPEFTQMVDFSGGSPVNRISQLAESSSCCLPNWVDEDDWITVRINGNPQEDNLYTNDVYVEEDDDDIESTRTHSFLFSDFDLVAGFSVFDYDVFESSCCESVVFSRSIDSKNMNDENWLLIDSDLCLGN